ncbi:MAG TPA: 1-acyl-sn-glycerol-3-phosphate acyltransferase [Polyangiaceae bacterium]|nr:1-acyl-sn-glycerol-3-phosphate acyltransferase [Polyangiaceae bacterium]
MKKFDADDLDARSPQQIERILPLVRWYTQRYVRLQVTGLEHLQPGPVLTVGNHNGGICGPDLLATLGVLWGTLGVAEPLYALAHDFAMQQLTPLGRALQPFGALRASADNAARALERGARVLVYPGGDLEAYRHYRERDRIVLGERRGYLRVARSTHAAIQPLVVHGAHRSALIFSEGRRLARALSLQRWARLQRFPMALCLPWGLALGPWLPYLPLPLSLRMRILPKTWLAANESIEHAHARITRSMQLALDELAREAS